MKPLSPHHRSNTDEELDESIKLYLDTNYYARLKNLDKSHPKLMVVFSGGNAIGKTTLAQKIEDELGAIVIENDAIRRVLKGLLGTADTKIVSPIMWKYTLVLYEHLSKASKNGLVVRDGVIDWHFDQLLPLFKKLGYELFIVGFDVSRQKNTELIKKRGDTPTFKEERAYVLLDEHKIHIERFRSMHTPDIMLHDDDLFDHDKVIQALKNRLDQLTA